METRRVMKKIKKGIVKVYADDSRVVVAGISPKQRVDYFARDNEGNYYLVTCPKNFSSYSQFRVYVGDKDSMKKANLVGASRLRDGGTTNIGFHLEGHDEGLLHFPFWGYKSESPFVAYGNAFDERKRKPIEVVGYLDRKFDLKKLKKGIRRDPIVRL